MQYRYSFREWEFLPISLSPTRMNTIGQVAAAVVRNRIASGLNVMDLPTRPLSKTYARQKSRKGLPAVRNWTFTGRLLSTLTVQGTMINSVSIGVSGSNYREFVHLAEYDRKVEQMMGISLRDQQQIHAAMQSEFADEVGLRK